ncbi:hypothetical protein D3C84_1032910 [compost metagenome]
MRVSLSLRRIIPLHGNQLWRGAGDVVAGIIDPVGVGHVGFDVEHRRAIEQVDARKQQAAGFDLFQFHH